jgi:phosphoenolpyruvate-protein kinase (PTS system EI component)
MSHTPIVARELGLPCVVNTKFASKARRTGDLTRVNAACGTVEVLEPAATFWRDVRIERMVFRVRDLRTDLSRRYFAISRAGTKSIAQHSGTEAPACNPRPRAH